MTWELEKWFHHWLVSPQLDRGGLVHLDNLGKGEIGDAQAPDPMWDVVLKGHPGFDVVILVLRRCAQEQCIDIVDLEVFE